MPGAAGELEAKVLSIINLGKQDVRDPQVARLRYHKHVWYAGIRIPKKDNSKFYFKKHFIII